MSDIRTEATDNTSEELLEEHMRVFEQDVALNVKYTFLDDSPCSSGDNRMEGSIAQQDRLD